MCIKKAEEQQQRERRAMEEEQEVVIVGAGIAGLATALALARVGVRSLVLESSHKLRAHGSAINFFPNAWRALEALGVATMLDDIYRPIVNGRITNIETGASQEMTPTATAGRNAMAVRSLHRKVLLETLAEELPPATIRFSSKLASIKTEVQKDSSVLKILRLENGAVIRAKVLIGCDGVHSVVANWLGLSAPVNSGRSAIRGLAIFEEGHGFKDEIQQFLSLGKRAGIVPLNEREFYWFIVHNSIQEEKELTRDPELIQWEVLNNLAREFPPEYLEVVRHSDLSTLSWAPLMLRVPWDVVLGPTHKEAVTVAGDAFHPMTPDLGQGGASALEDAVVLARSIARALRTGACTPKEVDEGMEKYVRERRWRAAGLVTGAFLAGWVQQGGSGCWGWLVKLFRDAIFYRFVFPKIMDAVRYDCGALPTTVCLEPPPPIPSPSPP